jgi:hypothetical protein
VLMMAEIQLLTKLSPSTVVELGDSIRFLPRDCCISLDKSR